MPAEPLRIGLLGAARIAPGALVEPARERSDVRLVSVAARDPARARAFAAEHGFDAASDSYAALVARDDIDLVYVALPPSGHCEWTIAALESGKAVLCEKPFAMDADEAQRMVAAAERTGKVLIEAFHYRFHRLMREALAVIGGGAIGEPLRARAAVEYPIPTREGEPRWAAEHGGGAMMDLGCYGVHALRTLLGGEPELVSARSRRQRGVDARTEARLLFPSGVEAEVRAAMDPAAPLTQIVIEGSDGRLDVGGFVLPQRFGRLSVARGGETRDVVIDGPSSYAAQLDHVVAVLRDGAPQLTGGTDAVANMRVLDRIRACAL
jgi:predicted dehydrogenase